MKLRACAVALFACPAVALAGNFATCLLDRLPGTANDVAASAALQVCLSAYPGGFTSVEQGAGRSWYSRQTGDECTLKKAGETRSNRAAALIGAACRKLYNEPPKSNFFDQFDPSSAHPALQKYDGQVTQ